jgi:hypothetical protein
VNKKKSMLEVVKREIKKHHLKLVVVLALIHIGIAYIQSWGPGLGDLNKMI